MKTILVTGAGGLLGTAIVPLLARNRRVVALSRTGGIAEIPNVVSLPADLSMPLDAELLPERIDAVVYLAQSPRFREFPAGAADVRQVNTDQPLALIDQARLRGASAFVYASTGSVYAPRPEPLTEDGPAPANGFYAASKMAAELLLRPYGEVMNVTSLRFFFIYGRGQKRDMLLPRLVDAVREGRTVNLQGRDGISINPIHVADAARAVEAALALKGTHTINVAGPEVLSIREICETAGRALGRDPTFETDLGSAPKHVVANTDRMAAMLGAPTTRFADAVEQLL